jgi:hypothetical protein
MAPVVHLGTRYIAEFVIFLYLCVLLLPSPTTFSAPDKNETSAAPKGQPPLFSIDPLTQLLVLFGFSMALYKVAAKKLKGSAPPAAVNPHLPSGCKEPDGALEVRLSKLLSRVKGFQGRVEESSWGSPLPVQ